MVRFNLFGAKLALTTASAVIAATTIHIKPSQAASFNFTLNSSFDPGGYYGDGSLSFTKSNLRGIGQETATLSQLPGASFLLGYEQVELPLYPPLGESFGTSDFSNPTFIFNNGNLVGIKTEASTPISSYDARYGYGINFIADDVVKLTGATYSSSFENSKDIFYDLDTGEITGTEYFGSSPIDQGNIFFQTIVPVTPSTPVPEPSEELGVIAAIGLGVIGIGKRQWKRRQKLV